jgi:hypothetical protein
VQGRDLHNESSWDRSQHKILKGKGCVGAVASGHLLVVDDLRYPASQVQHRAHVPQHLGLPFQLDAVALPGAFGDPNLIGRVGEVPTPHSRCEDERDEEGVFEVGREKGFGLVRLGHGVGERGERVGEG